LGGVIDQPGVVVLDGRIASAGADRAADAMMSKDAAFAQACGVRRSGNEIRSCGHLLEDRAGPVHGNEKTGLELDDLGEEALAL
jgi:hypothetical protein